MAIHLLTLAGIVLSAFAAGYFTRGAVEIKRKRKASERNGRIQ
jgi:hypothetical protein